MNLPGCRGLGEELTFLQKRHCEFMNSGGRGFFILNAKKLKCFGTKTVPKNKTS